MEIAVEPADISHVSVRDRGSLVEIERGIVEGKRKIRLSSHRSFRRKVSVVVMP